MQIMRQQILRLDLLNKDLRCGACYEDRPVSLEVHCIPLSVWEFWRSKKDTECFLEHKEETFSSEVEQRLKYGTDNEIHAVATLVGRFLPIYYP